jgi:hypothetical protein
MQRDEPYVSKDVVGTAYTLCFDIATTATVASCATVSWAKSPLCCRPASTISSTRPTRSWTSHDEEQLADVREQKPERDPYLVSHHLTLSMGEVIALSGVEEPSPRAWRFFVHKFALRATTTVRPLRQTSSR